MAYRVVITKAGGPKVLDIQEIPIPEPGQNEICIAVYFAGINFADTLMRLGFYQPRPPFPFTPGYEVSGVVHSIGSEVEGFEIGQRVVGLMRTGGQASHVIADASRTLPIPDEISLEAAASMPVTYITAHHMLHHLGNLKSTDSVLIHGGGGGVGTAALQLCQWAGVGNVWSTASAAKADIIQSYGATAIDRHREDFVEIIKSATKGKGIDHILDPIGGGHLKRSLSVLAQGGKLYTYGMSSAAPSSKRSLWKALKALRSRPKFDPMVMMSRNQGVFGIHMGTWNDEKVMQEQMENIIKGIKTGALTPIIDSIYDAKDVALAHQHIHDGKNIGKVLLKFVD
ncbi:MAG: alcohol dehydrogenase [Euryarchaeota archaeon]|jgi:NADPH:quinone reductase-like Zn-dependent oxidoreductase|nr:alcohol dehydrogenase [Euryarchaeota archaeon]CAI8293329.1 MAG: Quinone oxidoreductase 1 [Euryarchaeota archaeon UBA443]|tara:strand:- start:2009 stop:3031 length:1023 start_codon:yes stop_codon:yes gene_type:complete